MRGLNKAFQLIKFASKGGMTAGVSLLLWNKRTGVNRGVDTIWKKIMVLSYHVNVHLLYVKELKWTEKLV